MSAAAADISRRRGWAVNLAIAIILSGSLLAAVTGREYWPFSPYPMYAWLEPFRTAMRLQLYGVVLGEADREFPIAALTHLPPFDDARLASALSQLSWRGDRVGLLEALRYCLARYEQLRRAGRHDGPPLAGMRLYTLQWRELDPWARTAATPGERMLLGEVTADAGAIEHARPR